MARWSETLADLLILAGFLLAMWGVWTLFGAGWTRLSAGFSLVWFGTRFYRKGRTH